MHRCTWSSKVVPDPVPAPPPPWHLANNLTLQEILMKPITICHPSNYQIIALIIMIPVLWLWKPQRFTTYLSVSLSAPPGQPIQFRLFRLIRDGRFCTFLLTNERSIESVLICRRTANGDHLHPTCQDDDVQLPTCKFLPHNSGQCVTM